MGRARRWSRRERKRKTSGRRRVRGSRKKPGWRKRSRRIVRLGRRRG